MGGDKHFSFIINFSKNIQILFILYILHLKTKTTNQHAEHREHLGHMILSHLDCDIIYTDLRPVSEWTGRYNRDPGSLRTSEVFLLQRASNNLIKAAKKKNQKLK